MPAQFGADGIQLAAAHTDKVAADLRVGGVKSGQAGACCGEAGPALNEGGAARTCMLSCGPSTQGGYGWARAEGLRRATLPHTAR